MATITNETRSTGRDFKEEVKISIKILKKIVNQFDDDYVLDSDYEDKFWQDFKILADDATVMYGYQQLNKKVK